MIARVAVHLPISVWLTEDETYRPFEADYQGEHVVVFPPLQCPFEVRPDQEGNFDVNEIYRMLTPAANPRIYPFVRMDGRFVKHANLLQIDFIRPWFERTSGSAEDPARLTIEAVVRNVVERLRYVVGAPTFREFRLLDTFWTVRYLTDEGEELPEEKGFVRGRVNAPFTFTFTGLDASSWAAVTNLTFSFRPQLWERLYLDAQYLLPEIGPALTLAISAIETATDEMIRDHLKPDTQKAERLIARNWLGNRLDGVAKQLTMKSLKENSVLWDAFNRLRRARNAAAHEGTPILDGLEITEGVALQMILSVRPVLEWIEGFMSPSLRSHRDPHEPKWEWRSPVDSSPPVLGGDGRDTH